MKRAPEVLRLPGRDAAPLCVLNAVCLAYYEVKDSGGGGGGGNGNGNGGNGGNGGGGNGEGEVELVKEEKGRIPLVSIRNVRLCRKEEGPQVEVYVGTRTFYFVALDDATAQAWRLAIDAARHHNHRGDAVSRRLAERSKSRAVNVLAARVVRDSQLQHQRLSAAHSIDTSGLRRLSGGRSGVQQAAARGRRRRRPRPRGLRRPARGAPRGGCTSRTTSSSRASSSGATLCCGRAASSTSATSPRTSCSRRSPSATCSR